MQYEMRQPKELKIGDTFRFLGLGTKSMTVRGFRGYRNPKHPEFEHDGMTFVADVRDSKGRELGITLFPDQAILVEVAA